MKTTFENGADKQAAEQHLQSTIDDLTAYMNDRDNLYEEGNDDLPPIYEYGLSFDFVESDDDHRAYWRYQFSWGGPSDEVRFYQDGLIEYVYLDWFVGIGYRVTEEACFQWFRDWNKECCPTWDEEFEQDEYQY